MLKLGYLYNYQYISFSVFIPYATQCGSTIIMKARRSKLELYGKKEKKGTYLSKALEHPVQ